VADPVPDISQKGRLARLLQSLVIRAVIDQGFPFPLAQFFHRPAKGRPFI
jgi:hypothetical protein